MPQVLKEEVREQILSAALNVFCKQGYVKTRMADIAQVAAVSTSNLYRYYASKDEIFDIVFPPEFPKQFIKVFRNRVEDLSKTTDWASADGSSNHAAHILLEFMIKERERSLILLQGSEGTRHASIKDKLIKELSTLAIDFMECKKIIKPEIKIDPFIIREIFSNTISVMTKILQEHKDPEKIRHAFNFYWKYHLAGLQAVLKSE